MAEVHGTCDDRFEAVRTTFAANFDAGLDVGASVAVFLDGEPVVDLWGGTDRRRRHALGAGHDHQRLVDHEDR
jgi:CubicO group peptidase (beta-lactamase class C family)